MVLKHDLYSCLDGEAVLNTANIRDVLARFLEGELAVGGRMAYGGDLDGVQSELLLHVAL